MAMTSIYPLMWTKPNANYCVLFVLFFITLMVNTNALPNCNFLTWNVRGIFSSAGSLGQTLDDMNIDVAFISEHKL